MACLLPIRFTPYAVAFVIACAALVSMPTHAQPRPADYRFDPGFNGGAPFLDRFAGIADADYRGRFLVAVPDGENAPGPDGDVLVVGMVPGPGQVNNLHGNTNIGIVRYDRNGVRRELRGAGFYGHYDDQYVIMPGDEITRTSGMTELVAVTPVRNGFFYVLTNEYYSVAPQISLVFLRRFSTNGAYHGALEFIANRTDEDPEDYHAIDMTFVDDGPHGAIVILARKRWRWNAITGCDDAYGCPGLLRANLDATGTPTEDTGFGFERIEAPYESNDRYTFRPTAIASGSRGVLSPFVYVAGAHRNGTTVERVKVKKYNAAGDYLGQTLLNFRNDPAHAETSPRLAVENDALGSHHVFVAAQTQQSCAPGLGLAKLRSDGGLASDFGNGGKVLIGGSSDSLDSQACAFAKAVTPTGMVTDGAGRVAVVGQITDDVDWNNVYPAGMLALFATANGAVLDVAGHFYRATATGYPIGHAAFYGALPTRGGGFLLAGDQRDQAAGNRLMFITTRVRGDELFGDDFE